MIIVQLDENKYFTGSYAKVGSVPNGVKVPNLPEDMSKAKYYKYDMHEVEKVVQIEKTNPETLEVIVGEDGLPILEEVAITEKITEWIFDEEKYNNEVLAELKNEKIANIDSYKHEARLYFEYGNVGGIQRFMNEDILFINLTIEGMQKGELTEVYWKYSNGKYDIVNDISYFENMKLKGGMLINKSFQIESQVVQEINALNSVEEIKLYNEKARFDELFYAD